MITYFLSAILIGSLNLIVYPITGLPDVSLPAGFASSISGIGAMLGAFRFVLPDTIVAVFACFSFWIAYQIGIYTYIGIKWIYSKIPGVN